MRVLKCIVVGGLLVSASQAFAEDDPAAEIKLLKAKLKQLEQRVDDQGRKEKQIEAQARAIAAGRGLQGRALRACAVRQGLLQGRHADLRRLGRSHRHLPDAQSRFRHRLGLQLHSLSAGEELQHAGIALLGAAEPLLGSGRRQCRLRHASGGLRRNRLRGRGADRQLGCDQLLQSAHAPAQPRDRPHRSRLPRARRPVLVAECAEQGRHRSARRRCARRDRFRIRARLPRRAPARHPRLAGHRAGVQDRGVRRKSADGVLRRQRAGGRHAGGRAAGRAESQSSGQPDRPGRQLLQQRQQCQPEPGA